MLKDAILAIHGNIKRGWTEYSLYYYLIGLSVIIGGFFGLTGAFALFFSLGIFYWLGKFHVKITQNGRATPG